MSLAAGSMVWTGDGRQLKLDALLKSGGAGSVYRLQGSAGEVAKIYHAHVDHAHYERKIEAMLKLSPRLPDLSDGGRSYVQIAWPEATLRDKQGKFLGFLMPAVDVRATSELECILQERQARSLNLPTGLGAKITLAANLSAVIAELHAQRHYVVDLKPVNLRFYPQSLYMAMLDCDGFSIQGQGERFAAPQITPDYLAPEFQIKALTPAGEEQQDRFALAVVVFQLLNFGLHPYSGRPMSDALATDIPGRIRQRAYAYGLRANAYQQPNLSSGHQAMPMDLRTLFDRAFAGADAGRPAASEWRSLLTSYAQRTNQRLILCKRDAEHQHYAGQTCAACERAALLAKAKAAPRPRPTATRMPPLRTRPNPFARPPTRTPANRPVPTTMRGPLPPLRPYPTPSAQPQGLLAALGAWLFALAMRNAPWVIVLAAFLLFQMLKSLSDATTTSTYSHQDDSAPIEAPASGSSADDVYEAPARSYEAPARSYEDSAPPLETAPQLAEAMSSSDDSDRRSGDASGPSPMELSSTEVLVREAAEALASGRVRDYSRAMTAMYAAAYRRSNSVNSSSNAYDARYRAFMRDVRGQGRLERRALVMDLQRSLSADPLAAEPAFRLGCLSLVDGGRLGAKESFLRAIWADPNHGAAWHAYGAIAQNDAVAIGALANARLVSHSSDLQSEFPTALLESANISPHRVEQLSRAASQLPQQGQFAKAQTTAEFDGRSAARR
ncbi:hypothetical protein [Arenimonas sp.]|uniref:hypothetical protein n=1 Tax=Arenimonas sp. TaxID=1872635 RepID=UPI0039E6AC3B